MTKIESMIDKKIRRALINIASALHKTNNLIDLFRYIRSSLAEIIDTTNFFIALYEEGSDLLSMLYEEDENDHFETFNLEGTLTEQVILSKKPLLITEKEHRKKIESGEMELVGAQSKIWLGVPLLIEEKVIGVVVVQSYNDPNLYTHRHMKILEFVSGLIAIVIARRKAENELRKLNEKLEQKVAHRTKKLKESLETLEKTRDQLVQSEKMAALGNLVAGVAHEINTPVGVGVTAASHLQEKTEYIIKKYNNGQMKRSDLENYFENAINSAKMILSNLRHASENISSFKQVAVDQTSDEKRFFHVKDYVEEVLISLHPRLKKTNHNLTLKCNEKMEIYSYPGALSQIITNLIMNSLDHGFRNIDDGSMMISIKKQDNTLQMLYEDDGVGIPPNIQPQIFDPFFTTNRSRGGTGLGMHIVYNLVHHKLNGIIQCESEPQKYTRFIITFPLEEVSNHVS